ncbi:MAG TPA: thiamine phosphate synthase [Pyrinomonadaceae bacterium]|nr:thiamine phosphate synthase [Pyrinomonadaceae bacterium]
MNILRLVRSAVAARIDLVQIREKNLSAGVLYELATAAARITEGSATRLLINDRSDVAAASGAAGVHLTTSSLPTAVVRQAFGGEFVIGVSVHSIEEATVARSSGANFAVFGPVFDTASKRGYGPALGVPALARVTSELAPFPILAIGGVGLVNVGDCVAAGARGVAAITMLQQPDTLADVAEEIRRRSHEVSTNSR